MNIKKHMFLFLFLMTVSTQNTYAIESWEFKVFYGDTEIGEHHFNLVKENNEEKIEIKADFNVDVLFINVYSYKHNNTEIWKNSCLSSIDSLTNDDGEKFLVKGTNEKGIFKINSNAGYKEVDGCVKTFAYWDKSFIDSEALLNSQTGEIVDVDINFIANEKMLVRNEMINAQRYKLTTDELNIDLWYSDSNEWVALRSTTKDGGKLRYQIK